MCSNFLIVYVFMYVKFQIFLYSCMLENLEKDCGFIRREREAVVVHIFPAGDGGRERY